MPLFIIAIETKTLKPSCIRTYRYRYVCILLKGKDSLSSRM